MVLSGPPRTNTTASARVSRRAHASAITAEWKTLRIATVKAICCCCRTVVRLPIVCSGIWYACRTISSLVVLRCAGTLKWRKLNNAQQSFYRMANRCAPVTNNLYSITTANIGAAQQEKNEKQKLKLSEQTADLVAFGCDRTTAVNMLTADPNRKHRGADFLFSDACHTGCSKTLESDEFPFRANAHTICSEAIGERCQVRAQEFRVGAKLSVTWLEYIRTHSSTENCRASASILLLYSLYVSFNHSTHTYKWIFAIPVSSAFCLSLSLSLDALNGFVMIDKIKYEWNSK